MSNLPDTPKTDSGSKVKTYFDSYYYKQISYPSNDVDAVVAYFEKRGFQRTAAISVASVLLRQAKIDNVKIFEVLDTLKGLDSVELSSIVAEVLNANRPRISKLGYKLNPVLVQSELRNIKV